MSRYAEQITDLITRGGDQRAAAQRANGAIYGQTVAGLGQIPAQIQAQRQQQAQQQQQAELQKAQAANLTSETNARNRDQSTQDAQVLMAQHTQAVAMWLSSIAGAPPEQQPAIYAQGRDALTKAGVFDQQDLASTPEQFPGASWVKSRMAITLPAAERFKALFPESKPPEGFKLSAGETQFDSAGKTIASVPANAPAPKQYEVTVPGPNGPVKKLVSEADLQKGIPEYQKPDSGTSGDKADAEAIATAIANGEQPPVTTGLFRFAGPVRAALAKQGFDLSRANLDWTATQKHISTLNNAQQTRLTQSINALPDLLDSVDSLASQWKGGKFPPLNRANLLAAKNGAYGQDVASVARQMDAQIADVTADLGNVYMGGNSPTDQALGLAGKSLSGDWSEKVLHDMVTLARKNVTIRRNSIVNSGVAGASANNPYATPPAALAAPAGIPSVGSTFNGGKVLKVEKVQ